MTDEARDVIAQALHELCPDDRCKWMAATRADAILAALTAAGFHLLRWQDISEAPKDGQPVFLASKGDEDSPSHVAVGTWDANGTSWVDELGGTEGPWHHLEKTGIWLSGGGWFQSDEVTHFAPLPPAPPEPGR